MDSPNYLDATEDNKRMDLKQINQSQCSSKDSHSSISVNMKSSCDQSNIDIDLECLSDRDFQNSSCYVEGSENVSKTFSSCRPVGILPPQGPKIEKVSKPRLQTEGYSPYRQGTLLNRPQRSPNRIHTKKAPPKDFDLVAKQMLLMRQQKITDLKNELVAFQQQVLNLQRENRTLLKLKQRQERRLPLYFSGNDNIMQFIMRYDNELHVLRESLRQSQEKKRVAERGQREAEAQLQRTKDQLHKLKQLVNNNHLEEKDELTRKLEEERIRAKASEHKVKKLEKHLELTTKQLATQCRQTQKALKIIDTLKEKAQKLSAKAKVRDNSLSMAGKAENISRKAKERTEDMPSLPLAATDDNKADNSLHVKQNKKCRIQQKERDQEKEMVKMQKMAREDRETEKDLDNGIGKLYVEKQTANHLCSSNVSKWTREKEDRKRWMIEQEDKANLELTEEEYKELLLVNMENQQINYNFSDDTVCGSARAQLMWTHSRSSFRDSGGVSATDIPRRFETPDAKTTSKDLDFEIYCPSLGDSNIGAGPQSPGQTLSQQQGEGDKSLELRDLDKVSKDHFIQECFGSKISSPPSDPLNMMEMLNGEENVSGFQFKSKSTSGTPHNDNV